MRHKTITLCPTTYEEAKKMPNFSKWIRETLLAYQRGETLTDAIRQRNHWKAMYDTEVAKNESS